MKKEKGGLGATVLIYSLSMLLMMAVALLGLWRKMPRETPTVNEKVKETERYIYVNLEPTQEDEAQPEAEHVWIVKEHERRVGVFSENGVLLELLEIYTNTLPEADRRMLREGITVTTRSDLYALIEDYSE